MEKFKKKRLLLKDMATTLEAQLAVLKVGRAIRELEAAAVMLPSSAREAQQDIIQEYLKTLLEKYSPHLENTPERDYLERLRFEYLIEDPEVRSLYDTRLDALDFSVRTANVLQHAGVHYLGELVTKTEFDVLKLEHSGKRVLKNIQETIARTTPSLHLGMKIKYTPPRP